MHKIIFALSLTSLFAGISFATDISGLVFGTLDDAIPAAYVLYSPTLTTRIKSHPIFAVTEISTQTS